MQEVPDLFDLVPRSCFCPSSLSNMSEAVGTTHPLFVAFSGPHFWCVLGNRITFSLKLSPALSLWILLSPISFSNPTGSSSFGNFLWHIVVLEGDPGLIPTNPISRDLRTSLSPIMTHSSSEPNPLREVDWGSQDHPVCIQGGIRQAGVWCQFSFSRCLDFLLALRPQAASRRGASLGDFISKTRPEKLVRLSCLTQKQWGTVSRIYKALILICQY